ncbi:MAG TPA: DivIVA domain-containing protein [Acidimicrobiales bacterium]|nr:DivIVA domain-containing protein [Acidimicrobiales bacterium]
MADERRYTAADVPVTAEEVAHRGFGTTFRGFDPNEVRLYLTRVAESLRTSRDRQRELEQAVRDAEARAAKPQLDEATLTSALGEHTARIIRSAHEAASDIRAKAEESVEQILKDAHEEASRLRAEAERALADRVTEAEAEANGVRQAAEADAQGMRRRAQEQADRLIHGARAQSKEMAAEVQALRNRVMGDLMRRRRVALVQVEQLQAGRDRLLEAYRVVRRTLDEATDALQRAEADARAAAEAAAHRVAAEPEPTADELGLTTGEPGPAPEPEPEAEASPEPVYSRPPDVSSSVRVLRSVPADEKADAPTEPEDVRPTLKVVQPPSDVESVRVFKADTPPPPPPPAPVPEPVPEPEPEPVVEAVVEPEVVEPEAVEPEQARPEVDELFAKLRSDQDAPAESAETSEPEPVADATPEDELVARRDEALAPVIVAVTRKLKRALQDEQNEVLDRLRRHGGHRPSLAVAFPEALDHRARYIDGVMPDLADAMVAGIALAGGNAASDEDVVRGVADELTDALVGPLSRRLEGALDEAASMGDDESAITARVSAAYRDLKGNRLERLAADYAGSAFAAGAFVAFAPGTPLRWVVRDVDGQCPDCDDNALAGPTPRGEAFPTGQLRPPAHAGCRCLLAPASA